MLMRNILIALALWLLALTLDYWHERAHHLTGPVGIPGAIKTIEKKLGVWNHHG